MRLFPISIHRYLFVGFSLLALISLPFSEYTLSVAIIAIAVNWVIEGGWGEKLNVFRKRKSVWFFMLIYISLLLGMVHTQNLSYGISELRLKLPLLLPLVFATSKPFSRKELFIVLNFFVLSVFVASIISTILFVKIFSIGGANVREISPFISHIRFGLMVNIAMFISVFYMVKPYNSKPYHRILPGVVAAWFVVFLFILQSLTGIVILFCTSIFLLALLIFRISGSIGRYVSLVALCISVLFVFSFFAHRIDSFFTRHDVDINNLPVYTPNGNSYHHQPQKVQYENGYLVWINVCFSELEAEWNKRSSLELTGSDRMGQPLSYTLIRYITSMGLPKDSIGVSRLDNHDIALIESGVTSVIFRQHRFGIYPRLYQFLWEIDQYFYLNQVNGSPFIQRFIYIKAALSIIKSNFWFGVGTGDIVDEFMNYYTNNEQSLSPLFWYLSHNQYLTSWVSFGLVGFLALLLGWFAPFFAEKRHKDFLSITFFFILSLSMINEDTFQTHVGVCLASLFYAILIFGKESNESILVENDSAAN